MSGNQEEARQGREKGVMAECLVVVRHVGCRGSKASTQSGRKIALGVSVLLLTLLKETLALDLAVSTVSVVVSQVGSNCLSQGCLLRWNKPEIDHTIGMARRLHRSSCLWRRWWRAIGGGNRIRLYQWSLSRDISLDFTLTFHKFSACSSNLFCFAISLGGFLLSCFLQWKANKTYTENRRWNQSRKNEQWLS